MIHKDVIEENKHKRSYKKLFCDILQIVARMTRTFDEDSDKNL